MFFIIYFLIHFFILFPLSLILLILIHKYERVSETRTVYLKDIVIFGFISLIPIFNIGMIVICIFGLIFVSFEIFSKSQLGNKKLF